MEDGGNGKMAGRIVRRMEKEDRKFGRRMKEEREG